MYVEYFENGACISLHCRYIPHQGYGLEVEKDLTAIQKYLNPNQDGLQFHSRLVLCIHISNQQFRAFPDLYFKCQKSHSYYP